MRKIILKNIDEKTIEKLKKDFPKEDIYISPGWIDSHVHIFKNKKYFLDKKKWSENAGVIAYIDAGSTGVDDLPKINWSNLSQKYYIYAFININPLGINKNNELKNLSFSTKNHLDALSNKNIVGTKIRLSASVIDGDFTSYKKALKFLSKIKSPTMVHIGNSPPQIHKMFKLFKDTDIITHYSNGKNDDYIKFHNLKPNHIKDIGYGNESFSITRFKQLISKNIYPDIISTDLHNCAFKNKSVRLNKIMSLLLSLGINLEDVISAVTLNPYKSILKNKWPEYIHETYTAFTIKKQSLQLQDSYGQKIVINQIIKPLATYSKKGGYRKC